MLTNKLRNEAREIANDASNFHSAWIADLLQAADAGSEQSERILRIFLKYRRGTTRTSVAYHKTMEELAQAKIEGME